MNFLNQKERDLHLKALAVSKRFRKAEIDLIEILQEVDRAKLHRKFESCSLFKYATKELCLSEAVAGIFISVARKAMVIPELQNELKAEKLSVSVAAKLVSSLTPENAKELLDFAQNHSCREIERKARGLNPGLIQKEKVSVVSEDLMKIEFTMTLHDYELLCRARDLESQRTAKASSFQETTVAAIRTYHEKRDPVRKAKRSEKRDQKKSNRELQTSRTRSHQGSTPVTDETEQDVRLDEGTPSETTEQIFNPSREGLQRVPLKAHEKHAVYMKTKGTCSYVHSNGEKCTEARWVHIHHIIPVCEGGTNHIENLTLLCSGHHDLIHQIDLPIWEMRSPA